MGQAFPIGSHVDPDEQFSTSVLDRAAKLSDEEVLALADELHDLLRRRRTQRCSKEAYAVLRSGPEWQIVCHRRRMGHFKTLASAVEAGARLVRQAELSGRRIELLVQEDAGQLVPLDRSAPDAEELGRYHGAD